MDTYGCTNTLQVTLLSAESHAMHNVRRAEQVQVHEKYLAKVKPKARSGTPFIACLSISFAYLVLILYQIELIPYQNVLNVIALYYIILDAMEYIDCLTFFGH